MEITNISRRLRWMAAIKGVILILLGIVALRNPAAALVGFALYVGIATLATGVVLIVSAIANNKMRGWGYALAEGIMDVFFGVLLLSYPVLTAYLIPIMIGFWIFFGGILQLSTSIAYRNVISSWWVGLLYGILAILFASYILYTPVMSSFGFIMAIGVFALIFGVYYIISAITHKRIAY